MATRINLLEWLTSKFNTKEEISDLLDDKLDVEHNTDNNAHSNILSTVAKTGSYNDLSNTPTIDNSLSTSSTNALQNKVVTNALIDKSDIGHTHTWTTQSLGSYGTLYVNETLRLCFFIYVRQVAVSTTQTTVEAGVIPAKYRPLQNVISSTGHPKVHGGVTASGDVWSRATDSFSVGFSLTVMYPY